MCRNNAGNFCSLRHFLGWLITFSLPKFPLQLQKEMISFFLSTQIFLQFHHTLLERPKYILTQKKIYFRYHRERKWRFFFVCLFHCFLEMLAETGYQVLSYLCVFVCRALPHTPRGEKLTFPALHKQVRWNIFSGLKHIKKETSI